MWVPSQGSFFLLSVEPEQQVGSCSTACTPFPAWTFQVPPGVWGGIEDGARGPDSLPTAEVGCCCVRFQSPLRAPWEEVWCGRHCRLGPHRRHGWICSTFDFLRLLSPCLEHGDKYPLLVGGFSFVILKIKHLVQGALIDLKIKTRLN